jgi:hypothetical protein
MERKYVMKIYKRAKKLMEILNNLPKIIDSRYTLPVSTFNTKDGYRL